MSPLTESTRLVLKKPTGSGWTITPQTKVPVDPFRSQVSLLLHGDGANGSTTITDNSPSPKTVTAVGNAQISTDQSKFGGSSIAFDGTDDRIQIPNNNAFKFGSGNFTIEYWVYPANLTGVKQHINPDVSSDNTSFAIITNGTSLIYYLSSTGTTWNIASGISIGTASLNSWQHVALVRNANLFTPYLNGVAGTTTTSSAALFDFTSVLTIGASSILVPFGDTFNGYIDDLRITKGVARYTANFTPPAAPFPDI